MIKYVSSGGHVVLGFPAQLTYSTSKCAVIDAKMHESGNMCVALLRFTPSNAHCLVFWVLTLRAGPQGAVTAANAEWQCMSFADLGVISNSSGAGAAATAGTSSQLKGMAAAVASNPTNAGNVCLEWTDDGALVVLTSQENAAAMAALPSAGATGLLKVTLIPAEVIYSGAVHQHWENISEVIQSSLGRIGSVRALPGAVVHTLDAAVGAGGRMRSQLVKTVHIMVAGESKAMMLELTVSAASAAAGASSASFAAPVQVMWSDVS
jgi:hypothetical protein